MIDEYFCVLFFWYGSFNKIIFVVCDGCYEIFIIFKEIVLFKIVIVVKIGMFKIKRKWID